MHDEDQPAVADVPGTVQRSGARNGRKSGSTHVVYRTSGKKNGRSMVCTGNVASLMGVLEIFHLVQAIFFRTVHCSCALPMRFVGGPFCSCGVPIWVLLGSVFGDRQRVW